jgi:hypothetical protein
METRLIIALTLVALIVVLATWGIIRFARRRRDFAVRQMGRGKNNGAIPPQ